MAYTVPGSDPLDSDHAAITSAMIMEYRDRLALMRLHENKYPFYRLAPMQRDIPKNHGKTIRFHRWSNLTPVTTDLTEGITPTSTALSASSFTAGLHQRGAYTVLTDLLKDVALTNVEREAMNILGDQMWESAEVLVRDSLGAPSAQTSCSLGQFHTAGFPVYGATGAQVWAQTGAVHVSACALSTFSVNTIRYLTRELKRKKVRPIGGAFKAIVGVTTAGHLRNNPKLEAFLQGTSEGVKFIKAGDVEAGFMGRIEGFDFYESNYAHEISCRAATETAASTCFVNLIFGQGAYARTKVTNSKHVMRIIVKNPGKNTQSDPLDQRSTVGWKMWFGASITNTSCGLFYLFKRPDSDIMGW